MSFWSDLFSKGEDPAPTFDDPRLGHMTWSEDDEAWLGSHQGLSFAVSYDRRRDPTPEVLAYAWEVLADPVWLNQTLQTAKSEAIREYPAWAKPEIEGLTFELIHFYVHKKGRRIFAMLGGGQNYRCWRIEYGDRICEGIGFDS